MCIVSIWNNLNKNYKIDFFKITQFEKLFITDIRVTLDNKLLNQKYVYASACHDMKNISLIKALSELVERLVFLAPFVGPIEFINGKQYTPDINKHLIPLSLVTPYLSDKSTFSSPGHACHTDSNIAVNASENEYYEYYIKSTLSDALSQATLSEENDTEFKFNGLNDPTILDAFKKIVIRYPSFYFCLVWHPVYSYVVGSACNESKDIAIEKAFCEGLSLLHAAKKDEDNIDLIEDFKVDYTGIYPGYYVSSQIIPKPNIIRRHSQILSELKLCMFQAVHHV